MPSLACSDDKDVEYEGRSEGSCDLKDCSAHPLVRWFEEAVRPELVHINLKLDGLLGSGCGGRQHEEGVESSKGLSRLQEVLAAPCPGAQRVSTWSQGSRVSFWRGDESRQSSKRSIRSDNALQSSVSFNEVVPAFQRIDHTPDTPGRVTTSSRAYRCKESGMSTMTKQEVEAAAARIIHRRRWIQCLDELWRVLDDADSGGVAHCVAMVMPTLIFATVFVTLIQTLEQSPLNGVPAAVLETVIDTIFTLEVILRFVACPNRKIFFLSFYNLVDIAAAAPLVLRAAVGFVLPHGRIQSTPQGVLLYALPLLRLLKTLRRFEKFQLLLKAFSLAAEALPVLLYMLFIITLFFSVLIYLVEPRSNIESLMNAVWLTIVTMTTVGYGDIIPQSVVGSVITGVLIVITVLYMAVPLGIIGNAFTQTWNDRDRILLTHRTRDRLRQWGYEASDIPILFHVSGQHEDSDPNHPHTNTGGGSLTVDEFRALLKRMQVGFNDERIYHLFQSFDIGNTGKIDDRAFVRTLFPNDYHSIYQDQKTPRRSEQNLDRVSSFLRADSRPV